MHISMFCIRSRPNFKFPKLKGRAAEIKCLVHPLLLTWCEFMDSTSVVHKQIRLLLQCSARLEDLVYDHKKEYKFAPDAHADLMRNCEISWSCRQLFRTTSVVRALKSSISSPSTTSCGIVASLRSI